LAGALDEMGSVVVMPGTGVPERGEPDASDTLGAVGRPRGSAECCRLSCGELGGFVDLRRDDVHIP
jgi:hypothetical protein